MIEWLDNRLSWMWKTPLTAIVWGGLSACALVGVTVWIGSLIQLIHSLVAYWRG